MVQGAAVDRFSKLVHGSPTVFSGDIFVLRVILKGPPFYLNLIKVWGFLRGEEAQMKRKGDFVADFWYGSNCKAAHGDRGRL